MVKWLSVFVPMLKIVLIILLGAGSTQSAAQTTTTGNGPPRNLILVIGDGMGPQQIGLLEAYARQAPRSIIENRTTAFTRLLADGGTLGMSMTNAANVLGTDSAASATQLATGKLSGPEMIGIDIDGKPHPTLLEIAHELGKSTGIVSNVRLTHATPASFAAHQPHRGLENEIAVDMLATGVDVMLSGGLRHWVPQQANDPGSATYQQLQRITGGAVAIESRREDDRNLLEEARQQGYELVFSESQMKQAKAGKILGLFAASAFPDAITARHLRNNNGTIPTLTEMSAKAIASLAENEMGFVLVIEAGLIDWAAHYNDTGTMLHEMLGINEVLNNVLDWAGNRDDTLVVVTADHETGGFGFSYSSADLPAAVAFPGSAFPGVQFQPGSNYGNPGILDKLHAQKLSYTGIFTDNFDTLPAQQQTPLTLMELVNQYTEFSITRSQAARVLATAANPYYVEGHDDLGYKIVPRMDVNAAFYSSPGDDNRQNLLAIEVANSQSVVWSNGNHTATPVMVFASGPRHTTRQFIQVMDHPQLGNKLRKIVQAGNDQ
jgi:alkaline phosphatase